jgi:hypothetical protein
MYLALIVPTQTDGRADGSAADRTYGVRRSKGETLSSQKRSHWTNLIQMRLHPSSQRDRSGIAKPIRS